jgi:hypothetical protein
MADVVVLLPRRCAWCRSAWTATGWTAGVPEDPEQETSTICPTCVAVLQQRGASR